MNINNEQCTTTVAELSHYPAGPRSAVGSASDLKATGPGFDTRPGRILRMSVTDESMSTKYWLTA